MGSDRSKFFRIIEINLFRGLKRALQRIFGAFFGFQTVHALDPRQAGNTTRTSQASANNSRKASDGAGKRSYRILNEKKGA
jgi:hypothetical protein